MIPQFYIVDFLLCAKFHVMVRVVMHVCNERIQRSANYIDTLLQKVMLI